MDRYVFAEITALASSFDAIGMHDVADSIDAELVRLAQYSGPYNVNVPMEGRIQPYDRYHEKELDGVETNHKNHPRLRPTDFVDDGLTPEDLGKGDDMTPSEKREFDKMHAADEEEGDETIFRMDDRDPEKGGDPFRMHDQGTAGWGFITHAPDQAGMVGLDRFTWDNKRGIYDNPSDKYKLLLPQT